MGAVRAGLKSIEDALEIRGRVFLAYENAERERDPARRRARMTFAIIGGGPIAMVRPLPRAALRAAPGEIESRVVSVARVSRR